MKRVITHWSAGGYAPSDLEKEHYHFMIDGEGKTHSGKYKPEDNLSIADGKYAKHTKGTNQDSIGVAVLAMAGATERPLSFGKYPLKKLQWDALVLLVASLCKKYKILVTPKTVLSHAEVEKTLGNKQMGKWDIAYLPFDSTVKGASAVGNKFRSQVAAAMLKK